MEQLGKNIDDLHAEDNDESIDTTHFQIASIRLGFKLIQRNTRIIFLVQQQFSGKMYKCMGT